MFQVGLFLIIECFLVIKFSCCTDVSSEEGAAEEEFGEDDLAFLDPDDEVCCYSYTLREVRGECFNCCDIRIWMTCLPIPQILLIYRRTRVLTVVSLIHAALYSALRLARLELVLRMCYFYLLCTNTVSAVVL